jgi:hypothetical protein
LDPRKLITKNGLYENLGIRNLHRPEEMLVIIPKTPHNYG